MKKNLIYLLSLVIIVFSSCEDKRDAFDLSGECNVIELALDGFDGVITQSSKTIVVTLEEGYDLSLMEVTKLVVSEGATANIAVGDELSMLAGRTILVSNGDAVQEWYLSAVHEQKQIDNPKAVYVGLANTKDELNIEEQTACQWFLSNMEDAAYISMIDLANGNVNLSECKLVFWHFHKDGGVDGRNAFETEAAVALKAANRLKAYYQAGGSLLLTRYATYLPAYIGEADVLPNNCWGGNEAQPETVNEPWSFFATGNMNHTLFANLVMNDGEPERIYMNDAGYGITNSTAQWHIGTDWGGFADYDAWRTATGATDLAYGGDGAIVVWEFPKNDAHGGIICIGSGCYDWYSSLSATEHYHNNVVIMTQNAINHLTK